MCLAQAPQHSEAGEAQTRGPSVSSQALYHWANNPLCLVSWNQVKSNQVSVLHHACLNLIYSSDAKSLFQSRWNRYVIFQVHK